MKGPIGGKSLSVPFYGCPQCGWATTASLSTALKAHHVSSPACGGELELIDDWHLPRRERERTVRRAARPAKIEPLPRARPRERAGADAPTFPPFDRA